MTLTSPAPTPPVADHEVDRSRRAPIAPGRRIRAPWLVIAAAAFALAVVVVLWAVSRAADRTDAVVVRAPIDAGDVITREHLAVTGIANDQGFGRIYTADQLDALVGATALVDLSVGDLLGPAVLGSSPPLGSDERLVGATLRVGRYPAEAKEGDLATVVHLDGATEPGTGRVEARILRVSVSETDEASVTLAVASSDAPAVATWAARDSMALVIEPLGSGR